MGWLDEIGGRSQSKSYLLLVHDRDHDDWNTSRCSERYEGLEPAPAWHQDIEGDGFRKELLGLLHRLRS